MAEVLASLDRMAIQHVSEVEQSITRWYIAPAPPSVAQLTHRDCDMTSGSAASSGVTMLFIYLQRKTASLVSHFTR